MRGSAGRIMIRPGQAIMIAWLTTAHAPLWEAAHERPPPQKDAVSDLDGQRTVSTTVLLSSTTHVCPTPGAHSA